MASGARSLPSANRMFELVLAGYSPSDVSEHLRVVDAERLRLAADRDAAATQADRLATDLDAAWTETERLQARLTRLAVSPDTIEGIIERLQWMLQVYRDEVSEMQARADTAAEATKAAADAAAEATKAAARKEAGDLADRIKHQAAQLDAENTRAREEIRLHRSQNAGRTGPAGTAGR